MLRSGIFAEQFDDVNWLKKWFGIKQKEVDIMKFLVVGLGNMGLEYENTRHNIGFQVVERLANAHKSEWKNEHLGDVAKIKHRGRSLILLKPSTFMNRSGKSIRYWLQKEKIITQNLVVVVDDLNLDFGQIRLRSKGSDGGHNGLNNINEYLGSNYTRLRIGIGRDFAKGRQVDFVLGKWTTDEESMVDKIIQHASDAVLSYSFRGLSQTMSTFNGNILEKKP